jgi:hypothetical protein
MTVATVTINYEKFINTGLIPGSDFENFVLDDILEWADANFAEDAQVSLKDIISIYWQYQLDGDDESV